MSLFERMHGCLAGLALGDCLGMPTEFMTPAQIAEEFGWVERPVRAPGWHPHHTFHPAQVTDDTGQALAIARAYREDGTLSAGDVARELLAWADGAAEDLPLIAGPSTQRALQRLRAGEDPRQTGHQGTTNGAAYRAVVVGLAACRRPDALLEQVVEACLPTHGTAPAISGAAAVACAVATAVREGATLADIFAAAQEGAVRGRELGAWAWGTPLEKRIALALRLVADDPRPAVALGKLYDYVGVDLLVAESVASAFGIVALAQGEPMRAIQYGANIGGDTDTIAALAGAICGAWKGIAAIDPQMLVQVEAVNQLDLDAESRRLERIASFPHPV
jgi:ADP-ribosylglycohydrolase